tara:strand:- start:58 stop:216 length:159 start_codon:yes stop_codon:yes gene_type:complete
MWLGIGYTIPMRGDKNLHIPPPSQGIFIALEINTPGLTDVFLLESGGKIELE